MSKKIKLSHNQLTIIKQNKIQYFKCTVLIFKFSNQMKSNSFFGIRKIMLKEQKMYNNKDERSQRKTKHKLLQDMPITYA